MVDGAPGCPGSRGVPPNHMRRRSGSRLPGRLDRAPPRAARPVPGRPAAWRSVQHRQRLSRNRDASRSSGAPGRPEPGQHGGIAPAGFADSACPPRAGHGDAPGPRSQGCSRSGRGHTAGRCAPSPGSGRNRTAVRAPPSALVPRSRGLDATTNECKDRACTRAQHGVGRSDGHCPGEVVAALGFSSACPDDAQAQAIRATPLAHDDQHRPTH